MALPKIYDYLEHQWHNNTTPSINEDELNAISYGLSEVDDRVIDITGTLMEDVPQILEDMEILKPAVQQIATNVQRAETAADTAEDAAESATASEQAATTAADEATTAAENIEELLGAPTFSVDFSTGQLTYSIDTIYTFTINTTTGDLEWEVA